MEELPPSRAGGKPLDQQPDPRPEGQHREPEVDPGRDPVKTPADALHWHQEHGGHAADGELPQQGQKHPGDSPHANLRRAIPPRTDSINRQGAKHAN